MVQRGSMFDSRLEILRPLKESSSSGPNLVGLGPPDLDSGPDLFDLLIFDLLLFDLLLLLLTLDLLLQHLQSWAFLLEPTLLNAQALRGNVLLSDADDFRPSCFRKSQASII